MPQAIYADMFYWVKYELNVITLLMQLAKSPYEFNFSECEWS